MRRILKTKSVLVSFLLILGALIIWAFELFKSINYDSVLFQYDSASIDFRFIIIVVWLSCVSIIFATIKNDKFPLVCIIELLLVSIINIYILKNEVYYYLPWIYNESYAFTIFVYLYCSLFSLIFTLFQLVTLRLKINHILEL